MIVSPLSHRVGCPELGEEGLRTNLRPIALDLLFMPTRVPLCPIPGIPLAVDKRGLTVLLFFKGKKLNENSCLVDMTCVFPNCQ